MCLLHIICTQIYYNSKICLPEAFGTEADFYIFIALRLQFHCSTNFLN